MALPFQVTLIMGNITVSVNANCKSCVICPGGGLSKSVCVELVVGCGPETNTVTLCLGNKQLTHVGTQHEGVWDIWGRDRYAIVYCHEKM